MPFVPARRRHRTGRVRPAWTALVACVVAAGLTAGCQSSAASSGRVEVVAGFWPLADAAERVGGSRVRVTNLTPAGAEPHDLELRASQVAAIQDADLVVVLGHGFQPAVEKAARNPRRRIVVLDRLPAAANAGRGRDPHVWLDPTLMAAIADLIADALVAADPAHRAAYREGARTTHAQLDALDAELAAQFRACATRIFVTAHEAFGFFARRYRLEERAVVGVAPDAEPEPGHLAELVDLIRGQRLTTVFSEPLTSTKLAQALAREAGVRVEILNPIEGVPDADLRRGATYNSLMRANAAKLQRVLECS